MKTRLIAIALTLASTTTLAQQPSPPSVDEVKQQLSQMLIEANLREASWRMSVERLAKEVERLQKECPKPAEVKK